MLTINIILGSGLTLTLDPLYLCLTLVWSRNICIKMNLLSVSLDYGGADCVESMLL